MDRPSNPNVSRGQFQKLDAELREGGFTHTIHGPPATPPGYVVSDPGEKRYDMGKSRAEAPEEGYSPSRLPQFVRNARVDFSAAGPHLGGWLEKDEESGKVEAVLDKSRKYPDLPSANKAMRRNNQEAGYNLSTGEYIYNIHHPKNAGRLWDNLGRLGQ